MTMRITRSRHLVCPLFVANRWVHVAKRKKHRGHSFFSREAFVFVVCRLVLYDEVNYSYLSPPSSFNRIFIYFICPYTSLNNLHIKHKPKKFQLKRLLILILCIVFHHFLLMDDLTIRLLFHPSFKCRMILYFINMVHRFLYSEI